MRKPIAIYFVAAWCLIALILMIGSIKNLVLVHFAEGEADWLKSLTGVAVILAIWHVYQLVQLKALNRWLSVAVFSWWTFTLIWNCIAIFSQLERPRVLVVLIVPAILNVASIWFLVRRNFREFSLQYASARAKERHSRQMQKAAQERMAREIKNRKGNML
jgi:predicted membrane channel-forming protein YqfA (hemolysin III family)